ncbi:hypothetical protein ACMHYB_57915 [Sorangium sp. So ce1128]
MDVFHWCIEVARHGNRNPWIQVSAEVQFHGSSSPARWLYAPMTYRRRAFRQSLSFDAARREARDAGGDDERAIGAGERAAERLDRAAVLLASANRTTSSARSTCR